MVMVQNIVVVAILGLLVAAWWRGRRVRLKEEREFLGTLRLVVEPERRRKSPAGQMPSSVVASSGPVTEMTYDISYWSGRGEPSRRRIHIEGVSAYGGSLYLEAWCHLRREDRSFRTDRIHEMVSAQTGEVIDSPTAHARALRKVLYAPGKDFNAVLARARPGIMVLVWIARGDHELSDEELDAIVEYVERRERLHKSRKVADDWNRVVMRQAIEGGRIVMADAVAALAPLAADSPERLLIADTARHLATLEPAAARRAMKLGF